MQEFSGIQPPSNGGMDDLESFQACLAEIRTTMSKKKSFSRCGAWGDSFLKATHRRRGHLSSFSRHHEGEA